MVTPQADKEMIVQLHSLGKSKAAITKATGYAWATITKVLTEAERDPDLKAARALALDAMASRVTLKADEIITSIGPEELEAGLIKAYDDDGKLKSAKRYGPTLTEKATAGAILIDKKKILADMKAALLANGVDAGGLPLPGNVDDALRQIAGRVKQLQLVNVQFRDAHEDLITSVEEVTGEDLQAQAVDADFEELDLDNVPVQE